MTNAPDLSHRTVIEKRVGAVALITLNRPERLNAWTDEMGERYRDLLTAADADPEVRAIVVTGAGRGFCAGIDIDTLATGHQQRDGVHRQGRDPRAGPRAQHTERETRLVDVSPNRPPWRQLLPDLKGAAATVAFVTSAFARTQSRARRRGEGCSARGAAMSSKGGNAGVVARLDVRPQFRRGARVLSPGGGRVQRLL